MAKNINAKFRIHDPMGDTENLEVFQEMEKVMDICVNITAMISA